MSNSSESSKFTTRILNICCKFHDRENNINWFLKSPKILCSLGGRHVKRVKNRQVFINMHTCITCMIVHSTKQQFHQLLLIPNEWSLGKTGKPSRGYHWAVPSLPKSVHFQYSIGQWYHLLNMKPKCVLKARNSSSGQHRCETSVESVAVQ